MRPGRCLCQTFGCWAPNARRCCGRCGCAELLATVAPHISQCLFLFLSVAIGEAQRNSMCGGAGQGGQRGCDMPGERAAPRAGVRQPRGRDHIMGCRQRHRTAEHRCVPSAPRLQASPAPKRSDYSMSTPASVACPEHLNASPLPLLCSKGRCVECPPSILSHTGLLTTAAVCMQGSLSLQAGNVAAQS